MLDEIRKENPKAGASFRWCVDVDGGKDFVLKLQHLPAALEFLEGRPSLERDTCPGSVICDIKMQVDMENWPSISGPKPVLFTPDRSATAAAIKEKGRGRARFFKGKNCLKD